MKSYAHQASSSKNIFVGVIIAIIILSVLSDPANMQIVAANIRANISNLFHILFN